MRFSVLNFRVVEHHTITDRPIRRFINRLLGKKEEVLYHFDCVLIVGTEDRLSIKRIKERSDYIMLPNKVKLLVWAVDRNVIRAKTANAIDIDLRGLRPMECYLVYDKRHGHVTYDM